MNRISNTVSLFFAIFFFYVTFCFGFSEKLLNYKIGKIELSGNRKIADRIINRVILSNERPLFSKPIFYEKLFRDDLKSITQLYHNNGYLDAHISSEITVIDSVDNLLSIRVLIEEGEQTHVDTISFLGNNRFPNYRLKKVLSQKEKNAFNRSLLEKDNLSLLSLYARYGYIDTIIRPELTLDRADHRMSIIYVVSEGDQVRIRSIRTTGLKKTRPVIVHRELSFQADSIFNYQKVIKSQQHLLNTGLFKTVSIMPVLFDSSRPDIRDVIVKVEEKETGELNFGVGFGSYERLRGSTEFFQNNLMGMANQIGARFRLSIKLQRIEFSFTNPWFIFNRMKFDLNTFKEYREEPNYKLNAIGGRATVGKEIGNHLSFDFGYKLDDVAYSNIKDDREINKLNRGKISRLRFRFNRETRDNQVNTTTGAFLEQRVELAGGFLKGAHSFLKFTSENRFFGKISNRSPLVFGARIYLGWMDQFGESLIIPLNERFYAGGDGSIRGFSRHRVGPKRDGDLPVGGKFITITNYEIRFPLYKKLGATFFWDAGNVWHNAEQFNLNDLRHGTGCGLRYNSPLGIARLDFGLNVNKKANEKIGEIYFTIGQFF